MYIYDRFLDLLNWLWTSMYRTMALHNQNSGVAWSGILKYINRMMELHVSIYWEIWIESLTAIFLFYGDPELNYGEVPPREKMSDLGEMQLFLGQWKYIVSLQWPSHERHDISDHRLFDRQINSLFGLTYYKYQNSNYRPFVKRSQ